MRFSVETWAPDYGGSVGAEALGDTEAQVDLTVERDPADWAPIRPSAEPAAGVLFVDGVQRVDARVWIEHDDGTAHAGVCASWAAGVVRCDGRAEVAAAEVRRGVLTTAPDLGPIDTRHGRYDPHPVTEQAGGDPIGQTLGQVRGALEARVAVAAAGGHDLLVVDGPLGDRRHVAGAVGYIKTHHVSYLPPALHPVIARLGAGERTPLFRVGGHRYRWSWYLRLPGPASHAWWGVVRCEASGDLPAAEAVARADVVAATLPRFASQPHNDPRAPQNLHPIAGLERELKRRLGDAALLERALRAAAGQATGTASTTL